MPDTLAERTLPDGRRLAVLPLLFGAARLGVGPPTCTEFDDVWDYPSAAAAIAAAETWDGTGEPDGWHRHPRTKRYRPDGDPSREYRKEE